MTKSIRFGIARGLTGLIATILLATAASAQQAFTTRTAHVRAGPDRGYPLVATLPPGVSVYVNGCLGNYSWCDVSAGPNRGWVYARQLRYTYQGRPLTIYGNGALRRCLSWSSASARTGIVIIVTDPGIASRTAGTTGVRVRHGHRDFARRHRATRSFARCRVLRAPGL